MKKKNIILLIMIAIIFNPCFCECNAVSNSINYEITSFSISNAGVINMYGWSFIDHIDNYGGKNLNTYIIAYTGDWNDSYKTSDGCSEHSSSCKRYAATTGVKIDGHILDFYYIRCTDDACTSQDNARRKSLIESRSDYAGTADACTSNKSDNVSYGGSHCLYYNLGFRVSIPISELLNTFGDGATIKFRIASRVARYGFSTGLWDTSDLGILPDVCKTIYGKKCKNKSNTTFKSSRSTVAGSEQTYVEGDVVKTSYDVAWNEITIGSMEKKVYFTAINARRFTGRSTANSSGTFAHNQNYDVVTYRSSVEKYANYKGNKSGSYYARMIKLQDGSSQYWAFTSWVKAAGHLTLKLKKNTKTITDACPTECCDEVCPPSSCDLQCIGENCDYSGDVCKFVEPSSIDPTTCSSSSFGECKNFEDNDMNCTQQATSKGEYYYKVSSDYLLEKFGDYANIVSNVPIVSDDNSSIIYKYGSSDDNVETSDYYFPILFKTNVLFKQSVSLTHDSEFVDGENVIAGRYFPYSFQLTSSTSWNSLATTGDSLTSTSTNNTYTSSILAKDKNTGNEFYVSLGLKTGEKIYKRASDGSFQEVVYGVNVYNDIANTYAKGRYQNIDSSSINVMFDDSNDKDQKLNVEPGSFTCDANYGTNDWNAGEVRSTNCTYTIHKAYYKNSGINYGDYSYFATAPNSSSYSPSVNSGSIYFVPLDTSDPLQFRISGSNLSLIRGWGVSYGATCSVNLIDKKIRYRTIDVSNPFPLGEYDDNWSSYINTYGLRRITDKSYSTIYYKTMKMQNFDDSNYGNYGTFSDIASDGTSSFVNNSFFQIINRGNHCASGLFSPSCDLHD